MREKNVLDLSRIERLREQKKITQLAMAEALSVSARGYKYKEQSGSFNMSDLPPLADMFGMSIEELVRELNPAYMSEADARAAHYRGQPLEEMANPFQFMEALYERRAEVAALLSAPPPAPAPATKPGAKGG